MKRKKRETLLDLGRTPTLEELREFFKANDWSTSIAPPIKSSSRLSTV